MIHFARITASHTTGRNDKSENVQGTLLLNWHVFTAGSAFSWRTTPAELRANGCSNQLNL